jgi:hypothetical protein
MTSENRSIVRKSPKVVPTYAEVPKPAARRRNGWKASGGRTPGERRSPVSLQLPITSKRIRRNLNPPSAEAKPLMMSHYFIALGSLPQRLPYPAPGIERDK